MGNKGNRSLKLLWLIPIVILGYIGWMNLLPLGGASTYFIDVGGDDTVGDARVTGPLDRISDKQEVGSTNFRELEKNLVYFELESLKLRDADEVGVRVKFKDEFPDDGKLILEARDEEDESYCWREGYVPFYRRLANLPLVAGDESIKVYAGKEGETGFQSVDDFLQNPPLRSVIATNDKGLGINREISPEELGKMDTGKSLPSDTFSAPANRSATGGGELETDTSLRTSHTFYFFAASDNVELRVTKRDLNWYEGPDELEMLVYSLDGELKGEAGIPDDGYTTSGKRKGVPQSGTLKIERLKPGVYRLELKVLSHGNDFIVTHLELNQARLVAARRVFLAGNYYLKKEIRPMEVWCYLYKDGEIRFLTYHRPGYKTSSYHPLGHLYGDALPLQIITISGEDGSQTVDIWAVDKWYSTATLKPGIYHIISRQGDIIVEAPDGYFAFTKDSVFLPVSSSNREQNGSLLINTTLRGGHTFWTYVTDGALELEVTKQDLNWYEKPDELAIEVYSLDDELEGSTIIPDDGDEGKGKGLGPPQSGSLRIEGLEPGPCRIELKSGGDLLIRKIEINQEKLVAGKLFLAGANPVYFKGGLVPDPVSLYGGNFKAGELKFRTLHKPGLQQVGIQGNDLDAVVDVNEVDSEFNISLEPGAYQMTIPRQDILIEPSGYLSFTPDSFFLPRRCEVVDLKYDLAWARENADYIVVNYGSYTPPIEDDDWLVVQASWKREGLFIEDNKLSFCLSIPHLDKEPEKVIPVDWIELTVKTLPIRERVVWVDELLDWVDTRVRSLPILESLGG